MVSLRIDPLLLFVVVASLWCGGALWFSTNDITFQDALFMGVSVVTSTGLSPMDYTALPASSQVVLLVAMICGSNILLSALPSVVMLATLNRRLKSPTQRDDRDIAQGRAEHERNVALLIIGSCIVAWGLLLLIVMMALLTRFSVARSLFLSVSCVNNVGLSLSKTDFLEYRGDLILVAIFAVVMPLGNTLFPVVLRSLLVGIRSFFQLMILRNDTRVCWRAWHLAADDLLRNPRLLCCHLFNSRDTLALVVMWCAITIVEFVMFIPEYNTSVFPAHGSITSQMLLAFFQTVAVRTSGFAIFDITLFRAGHLAVWMIAMYVTAYPVVLTGSTRRSHLQGSPELGSAATAGRDLVWVYVSVVVILFAQDRRIGTTQLDPSFFLRSCFECVSAFGNVGLSLPRSSGVVSFSSELNLMSRLAITVLMLAGKMRCLPSKFMVDVEAKDDTSEDEELELFVASPVTRVQGFPLPPEPSVA
ncbi:membrane-associated protein, putative [Bodo saltans]|uniref:Membrane-associated protein, putative n=1 Tax=Bodo saltans TaxID=75058 RepID=A0A0S4JPJ1_BODSA|nr:membrane-associated protein, putative [Bodo saltans]|eukprot:CUG92240.1 membrane-associated protein, putative [Bodo saltans]